MIAKVEALQSWLENITYQMCKFSYKEQSKYLAGQIAFLKMLCTRAGSEISDEAVQIFGGRGITTSGMGRFIAANNACQKYDSM
jgi:alkylation response protein AidB-like acyl-CoA dehydrogenase